MQYILSQQPNTGTGKKVSLKIVLGLNYNSYEDALEVTSLKSLKDRRQDKSLKFALKSLKHPINKKMFPMNEQENTQNTRNHEKFHVNFAHTEAYKRSAIPSLQRLLNLKDN